jgi:KipI family sensor histidine kinase inhibitor
MDRRPYGPAAWILDDVADPAGMALSIRSARLDGVQDVVPAESTVVVTCHPATWSEIGTRLDRLRPTAPGGDSGEPITIDVVYDGDDLDTVARATGLSVDEVVARHRDGTYRVAFCGFSPGFGYLAGLDPTLHVPRRSTPRTRVPPGAIAIAAGYSAVYPAPSPGGWHLIGTTEMTLWDARADPPAALWPGRLVRFRQVGP